MSLPKRYFPSLPWCHSTPDGLTERNFTTIHLECQFLDQTLKDSIEVCPYHIRLLRRSRLLQLFTTTGKHFHSADFNPQTNVLVTSTTMRITDVFTSCHECDYPVPHSCLQDILPFFRLRYQPYPYHKNLSTRRCQIQNRNLDTRDYTTCRPTSEFSEQHYLRPAVLHVTISNGKQSTLCSPPVCDLVSHLDILLFPTPDLQDRATLTPNSLSRSEIFIVENLLLQEDSTPPSLNQKYDALPYDPNSPREVRMLLEAPTPPKFNHSNDSTDSIPNDPNAYLTFFEQHPGLHLDEEVLSIPTYSSSPPRLQTPNPLAPSTSSAESVEHEHLQIGSMYITDPHLLHDPFESTSRTDSSVDSFESTTSNMFGSTTTLVATAITTPNTTITSIAEHH